MSLDELNQKIADLAAKLDTFETRLTSSSPKNYLPPSSPKKGKLFSQLEELESRFNNAASQSQSQPTTSEDSLSGLKSQLHQLESALSSLNTEVVSRFGEIKSNVSSLQNETNACTQEIVREIGPRVESFEKRIQEFDIKAQHLVETLTFEFEVRTKQFESVINQIREEQQSLASRQPVASQVPASNPVDLMKELDALALNIAKALAEEFESKLEVLENKIQSLRFDSQPSSSESDSLLPQLQSLESRFEKFQQLALERTQPAANPEIESHLRHIETQISELQKRFEGETREGLSVLARRLLETENKIQNIDASSQSAAQFLAQALQEQVQQLENRLAKNVATSSGSLSKEVLEAIFSRLDQIEKNVKAQNEEAFTAMEHIRKEQRDEIASLLAKIRETENQDFGELNQKIFSLFPHIETIQKELTSKINQVNEDLTNWKSKSGSFDARQAALQASEQFSPQIEALKKMFAALEEKMIQNKEVVHNDLKNQILQLEARIHDAHERSKSEFQNKVQGLNPRFEGLEACFNDLDSRLQEQIKNLSVQSATSLSESLNQLLPKIVDFESRLVSLNQIQDDERRNLQAALDFKAAELALRIEDLQNQNQLDREEAARQVARYFEDFRRVIAEVEAKSDTHSSTTLQALKAEIQKMETRFAGIQQDTKGEIDAATRDLKSRLDHTEKQMRVVEVQSLTNQNDLAERLVHRMQSVENQVKLSVTEASNQLSSRIDEVQGEVKYLKESTESSNQGLKTRLSDQEKQFQIHIEELRKQFEISITESLNQALPRIQQAETRIGTVESKFQEQFLAVDLKLQAHADQVLRVLKEYKQESQQSISEALNLLAPRIQELEKGFRSLDEESKRQAQGLKHEIQLYSDQLEEKFKELRAEALQIASEAVEGVAPRLEGFESRLQEFARYAELVSKNVIQDLAPKFEAMQNETRLVLDSKAQAFEARLSQKMAEAAESLSDFEQKLRGIDQERDKAIQSMWLDFCGRAEQLDTRVKEIRSKLNLILAGELRSDSRVDELGDQVALLKKDLQNLQSSKVPDATEIKIDSAQLNVFRQELDMEKKSRENLVRDLTDAVDTLKQYQSFVKLENAAIREGRRAAMDALVQIKQGPTDRATAETAELSLSRIESFYETSNRTGDITLKYRSDSGLEYTNYTIPPAVLISYLEKDSDWKVRAKAAEILGLWKSQGVPESLLKAAQQDPHLEVVRNALQSFQTITGYRCAESLNVSAAKTWWESHGSLVVPALESHA
jgi:chromosome segregation ATPase